MIGGVALRVTSPVLVGRVAEAAQLWAAFERAVAGSPATVVVAGEAGVGKTLLVSELLARARAHGALTLVGGCLDVGEGVVAYAPMVEALRPLGELLGPEELERVLAGARPELARLVPELGAPVASVSSRGGSVGAEATGVLEPGRLFELLLGVLHRLAERGAVLLVVEDLHWADRSTRNLLGFLVRNLRGGVALVLTYRSDELHRRHPLRGFLAELERSGRVERLELGRLGRRELGELLAGILGGPPAPGASGGPPSCRRRSGTCCWRGWRRCPRRPSGCSRSPPSPAGESTTTCSPRSRLSRRSAWSSCSARRSPTTCWWWMAAAAPTPFGTRWCRRRSTTTCCRSSGRRCTPRLLTRSPRGSRGRGARAPPSWGGLPTTGMPRTTWGGRCWPACRPGRLPRRPSRWPRAGSVRARGRSP